MSDEGRVWTVRQGLRYTNISDGPPLKTGESLRVVPESRLVEAERKWAEAVHDAEAVDEKLEAVEEKLVEAERERDEAKAECWKRVQDAHAEAAERTRLCESATLKAEGRARAAERALEEAAQRAYDAVIEASYATDIANPHQVAGLAKEAVRGSSGGGGDG